MFGVAPIEFEPLARHHDLAGIAELLREVGILTAVGLTLRPRPREAVIGRAAQQDGVGGTERGIDRRAHLVVEIREVPLIGSLHDPVERNEDACVDLPHGVETIGTHEIHRRCGNA